MDTPAIIIDKERLIATFKHLHPLRDFGHVKLLLALKSCSFIPVLDLIRDYIDGSTTSSLFEVRLGHNTIGKETHAYSVGFKETEFTLIPKLSSKVIFNSLSQFDRYYSYCKDIPLGLRYNPQLSYSPYPLANPCLENSRLGVKDLTEITQRLDKISGLLIHFNCSNDYFEMFKLLTTKIIRKLEPILNSLDWLSLGGGIDFTSPNYPLLKLAQFLKELSDRYHLQIYLEPGETLFKTCAELLTQVVDVIPGTPPIVIIDSSVEAHFLDQFIYKDPITIKNLLETESSVRVQLAGSSCLAGDIFGTYSFPSLPSIGDTLTLDYPLGYSLLKQSWFNGLKKPAIWLRDKDSLSLLRNPTVQDYLESNR